jgi:hypothetical protein
MVLTFELSLAAIRYQDVRLVPDPRLDTERGPDGEVRDDSRPFPRTQPDQHLVAELVDQLSAGGCIVKSVVENPPRPGRGPGFQHRVWDITGRVYRGVHPTDFRIAVTGEEAEPGAGDPETAVRLQVRGAYATDEMAQFIVARYDELWGRIETAAAASQVGADGRDIRNVDEPLAGSAVWAATLRRELEFVHVALTELRDAEGMAPEHARRLDELCVRIEDTLSGGRP